MNIRLTSIESSDTEKNSLSKGYLYKDIALDLKQTTSYNNRLKQTQKINDVQAIYDIQAVIQSITNAFLTSPGQKILNPAFGVDLRRYIFEPVTSINELEIRTDIRDRLPLWEPRIRLLSVDVLMDEDQQEYQIFLQIDVPSLNITGLSLQGVLNSNGYHTI